MAISNVHVVATTDAGTVNGLRIARSHALAKGFRVVLLVPRVVSYTRSLEQPDEDPREIAERYRAMTAAAGVEATVRVCFCREPQHVFGRLLLEHADVVIGGRHRRWWPTAEERLAKRLAAEGHAVTFVDVGQGRSEGQQVSELRLV